MFLELNNIITKLILGIVALPVLNVLGLWRSLDANFCQVCLGLVAFDAFTLFVGCQDSGRACVL